MRKHLSEAKIEVARFIRQHGKAAVGVMALLSFFYLYIAQSSNVWLAWGLTVIPGIIVIITAFCRVADLSENRTGAHWEARRIGLVLTGSVVAVILVAPFTLKPIFPSWEVVILLWGLGLTWLTTPNMVPWWKYVSGIGGVKPNPEDPGTDS